MKFSPHDIAIARRLIQQATSPVARVGAQPSTGPGDERIVHVEGEKPGQTTTLVLRGGDDETAGGNDVLLLRKASAARLRDLRLTDVQFVDIRRGIVRLKLPWMYVDRADLEIPAAAHPSTTRVYRDPFGDRASLVTRLLVEQPARRWGTREIAEEAGVSTMTASHVLRQLQEIGVVEANKRGRAFEARLTGLERLMEHWTRAYNWRRSASLTMEAPIGNTERFLPRLAATFGRRRWALTLQAGASVVAPHAAWDTVHVYVDDLQESLEHLHRTAGWRLGPGKLVLMRPWYADSAWAGVRTLHNLNIVSDLQLVLDLWHYPVRGREQANVLLRRIEQRVRDAQIFDK